MSFFDDLRSRHFQRTNPHGLSEAHKRAVSQDIEEILLRSYLMSPSDYGVYNAYYLFLTVHESRATPEAREHARRIANITVAHATTETESPFPWLTAASALFDQFFLDQQDAGATGSKVPAEAILSYKNRIQYCLNQYQELKDRAVEGHRWESIGAPRRAEADERYLFISRASLQFDPLISRAGATALPAYEAALEPKP